MSPLPVVLGLTICERVIIEEGTKNVSLVATFNRLNVDNFPSGPQKFSVFTVLTEGHGDGIIRLVVRSLETDEDVYDAELPVGFADPLTELRVLFRVATCVFDAPGVYQVTLLLDGEWLAQRNLRVLPKEP